MGEGGSSIRPNLLPGELDLSLSGAKVHGHYMGGISTFSALQHLHAQHPYLRRTENPQSRRGHNSAVRKGRKQSVRVCKSTVSREKDTAPIQACRSKDFRDRTHRILRYPRCRPEAQGRLVTRGVATLMACIDHGPHLSESRAVPVCEGIQCRNTH